MINGKIEEPTDPFHFFLLLLLPLDFAFCATFVDMNNWTDTNSFAFLFIMYVKKVALSYPLWFSPKEMILELWQQQASLSLFFGGSNTF